MHTHAPHSHTHTGLTFIFEVTWVIRLSPYHEERYDASSVLRRTRRTLWRQAGKSFIHWTSTCLHPTTHEASDVTPSPTPTPNSRCKSQIPLRYPASEPARELPRELLASWTLDSVIEFGLSGALLLASSSLAGRRPAANRSATRFELSRHVDIA